MARGRAWGNALGGYRKQKRDARGRFSGGSAGPVGRARSRRKGRPKKSRSQRVGNAIAYGYIGATAATGAAMLYQSKKLTNGSRAR